jgi:hypothetical protein
MTLYSFVLFAHVTSVLPLGACLSLEVLSLFYLWRASTLNEIQLWIEPVPGLSAIALGSILVILSPGIYLTIQTGYQNRGLSRNCPADDESERWTAESDAGS